MRKEEEIYLVDLPIIRRDYNKTKAAKFKGKITLISNWKGIIYDWKISFSELYFDLYATPAHFESKPAIFRHRDNILNLLDLKQEHRPSKTDKKIIKLANEQINIVNNYFNNREKFSSTIKNIVGIIKGNNPGGEYSNPNRAELVIDDSYIKSNLENFVILIDDLCRKKTECFEDYVDIATRITFEKYCQLDERINQMFEHLQKTKKVDINVFKIYSNKIKEYVNEYNAVFIDLEKLAAKKRAEYAKNIEKAYREKQLPFGFKGNDNTMYQRCHIYEYSTLRDKAVEVFIKENNEQRRNCFLEMIADPENFIPLPESYHRAFDGKKFSYNETGELFWFNHDYKNKFEDIKKYEKIDEDFMTHKRKEYFKIRNSLVKKAIENNKL